MAVGLPSSGGSLKERDLTEFGKWLKGKGKAVHGQPCLGPHVQELHWVLARWLLGLRGSETACLTSSQLILTAGWGVGAAV